MAPGYFRGWGLFVVSQEDEGQSGAGVRTSELANGFYRDK